MIRRIAAALACAASLAACTSATVGTTPTPEPAAGLSVGTQRVEAQAGIAVAEGIQMASLFAAVLEQLPLGGGTLPTGKCEDGVKSTIKVVNPEQLLVTIDTFYETSCKTRFTASTFQTTYFPSGTLRIAGTSTAYSTRGSAVAYATFSSDGTATPSGAQLVTTGTVSQTPHGAAQLSFGLTCTLGTANECGFGGIAPDASLAESIGATATISGFTGSGNATGKTAVKAYSAALGALKLAQGSGNSWTVRGGALVASPAGTFTESVDRAGLDATGTLQLSDSPNNAGAGLAFATRSGISQGRVDSLSPAASFSSFSTDATGTGSIAYSQGPGARILFFIISQ